MAEPRLLRQEHHAPRLVIGFTDLPPARALPGQSGRRCRESVIGVF
jgi:hypothetical protein